MNKYLAAPLLALICASCTLQVGSDDAESRDSAPETTEVVGSPPTTPPPTTNPPTTVAPTTTRATTTTTTALPTFTYAEEQQIAYELRLEYLSGYCWSNCTRAFPDTLDDYIDAATPWGLFDAVEVVSAMTHSQLDDICDEFWYYSDEELLDLYFYDQLDPDAVFATLWFTCDS